MKKKIELLSPAGDLGRLKIALLYGADAVYIGGQNYSLRANATNFSIEEIKEACSFAHNLDKKVYQTVNIVFHNEDVDGVYDYLKDVVSAGIDAFIVSDPFIISYIKKNFPNVEVHVSTQNSTTNVETVKFFKKEGVDRVVPARELSKEEIKEIIDETGLDIEVFIHGAMCTSYSGRCVLSNYITKRDSNRGGCAQVCRFVFENNKNPEFMLSSKDLNMIDYISDMMDLGIESFKVEGRMKSLYYIATVTNAYRNIIDSKINNTLTEEKIKYYKKILERCSNRENTPQYYDKLPTVNEQYYTGRNEISNKDFLGLILDYDEQSGIATIEQRNKFIKGDIVEVFGPNTNVTSFEIKNIINDEGIEVESASHAQEIVKINIPFKVEKYDIIRVQISWLLISIMLSFNTNAKERLETWRKKKFFLQKRVKKNLKMN